MICLGFVHGDSSILSGISFVVDITDSFNSIISPTVTKKDAPGHPFLDPCYDDNYASNR